MALTYLEITHGDNDPLLVTLTDDDGSAYDPTDAQEIWWTVKARLADTDAEAIWQKTLGDGVSIYDATAGQILLEHTAAQAAALEAGRSYYFDVRVLKSTGQVSTPITGMLTSTPRTATLSYTA